MNPTLMAGSVIVTFALIAYSIAIITEQRIRIISRRVLVFLSIGLSLDITATTCMIIGSPNTPYTLHGFIGYSALAVMIVETTLIWRLYLKNTINVSVPRAQHLYSRYAYAWWVIAYIIGAVMAANG